MSEEQKKPAVWKGFYVTDEGNLMPKPTESSIREERARRQAAYEREAQERNQGRQRFI